MEKIKLFFKGFHEGFKSFGLVISTIVNFLLLMIVYFVGVGLTSVFGKAFKKEFLDMKKRNKTYWEPRKSKKLTIKEIKRMF
jgi:large-conductance mechanosensitive channel